MNGALAKEGESITLGELIRSTRKSKRISMADLARSANITVPFLSDVERGRRNPSEEVLAKLAALLGLNNEELSELNPASALRDIRDLLENERELRIAFARIVRSVKQGKLSIKELTERLAL